MAENAFFDAVGFLNRSPFHRIVQYIDRNGRPAWLTTTALVDTEYGRDLLIRPLGRIVAVFKPKNAQQFSVILRPRQLRRRKIA